MDMLERAAMNRARAAIDVAMGGAPTAVNTANGDSGPGEFVQLAKALLRARGDILQARELVPFGCTRAHGVMQKAAVAAGGLSSPDWANEIGLGSLVTSFLNSPGTFGAFDSAKASMRRLPIRTRIAVASSAATANQVTAGVAAPLSKLVLANQTLEPIQVMAMLAVTEELVRASGPAANVFLGNEMKRAITAATDRVFLSTLVTGAPTTVCTSKDAEDVIGDIAALLALVDCNDTSKFFLVAPAGAAARMAIRLQAAGFRDIGVNGGTIANITVVASDETPLVTVAGSPTVATPTAVLFDADSICYDDAALTMDVSTAAALQMDSAPTNRSTLTGSPLRPVGTSVVSMFQTGSAALRMVRWLGIEPIGNGVAVLTRLTW